VVVIADVQSETRLHAEIDKLHADKREMENQMRVREHDNKQALDSAKTQMVFSVRLFIWLS
jgi:hypothetical protein